MMFCWNFVLYLALLDWTILTLYAIVIILLYRKVLHNFLLKLTCISDCWFLFRERIFWIDIKIIFLFFYNDGLHTFFIWSLYRYLLNINLDLKFLSHVQARIIYLKLMFWLLMKISWTQWVWGLSYVMSGLIII